MKGEDKKINKPVLLILDDWVADVNMRNGLLPSIMVKLRHGNISIFNIL